MTPTTIHLNKILDQRWPRGDERRTALDVFDLPFILDRIPMTNTTVLIFDITTSTTPAFMRRLRTERPNLQARGLGVIARQNWDAAEAAPQQTARSGSEDI